MKNTFTMLAFFIFRIVGYAQPGHIYIGSGNLNDIDLPLLESMHAAGGNGMFQLGTIVIDSTTDLSRIKYLREERSLQLEISLPAIPIEFSQITFSKLTNLVIYCDSVVNDLSNLTNMPALQQLTISQYTGKALNADFEGLPYLHMLTIYSAPHLENLESLSEGSSVTNIQLHLCPELTHLFTSYSGMQQQLKYLKLFEINSEFRLKELNRLSNLEWLYLSGLDFKAVPSYLPATLKTLYIGFNDLLMDYNAIENFDSLTQIKFEGNPLMDNWSQNWDQ